MIKVPVTIGFDNERIIGELSVDESKLPDNGRYCFALGISVDDQAAVPGEPTSKYSFNEPVKLITISAVTDENYFAFLAERKAAGVL